MAAEAIDLEKIAELARLEVSPQEAEGLARDCQAILEYFHAIRDLEAGKVQGDAVTERTAGPRPDRVEPDTLRRPPSELAPAWREGYFVLPRLPAMEAEAPDADAS